MNALATKTFNKELYGGKLPRGGLTGEYFYKVARRVPVLPDDAPSQPS